MHKGNEYFARLCKTNIIMIAEASRATMYSYHICKILSHKENKLLENVNVI